MKFPKLLLVFAVWVLSVSGIAAQPAASSQQKAIKKEDFERVDKRAKEFFKTASYRLIRTTESRVNNEQGSIETVKRIEEHLPPDRYHLLFEVTGPTSGKREWITIGENHFDKDGDGPWTRSSKDQRPSPILGRIFKREYFSDVPIVVDGKSVNVFVVIERAKTQVLRGLPKVVAIVRNRDGSITLQTSEIICVDKQTHWYDSDGRRIRVLGEVHCEEKGRPDDDYHYTEVYEYDPSIKIEAPNK